VNRANIKAVRLAAMRVVRLCNDAENELEVSGYRSYIMGPKTSGALRRASLDLTRALAEMRKP
jgi:hypothetical protein